VSISIRRLILADVEDANVILNQAFKTTDSRIPDLVRFLALDPAVFLLAIEDNQPVGTVGAMDYGPFAYVGNMAVLDQAQHQGIGSTLLRHVLAQLDTRGTSMILLDASLYGAPLYKRAGFVDCDGSHIFEYQGNHRAVPWSPSVRLLRESDLPALCDLDTLIFGASRARLFQILLTEIPDRALLVQDEMGQVSGFLFAQPRRLGPWVAKTPRDADQLLQAALSLPCPGALRVTVPEMNTAARQVLEQSGFRLVDTTHRHMRRGGLALPGQRTMLYGQMSFSLG
jgi:predicted N-acetyltransferase YhbS